MKLLALTFPATVNCSGATAVPTPTLFVNAAVLVSIFNCGVQVSLEASPSTSPEAISNV